MVLEVVIGDASVTIQIDEPFRLDVEAVMARIGLFAASKGTDLAALDVSGLILEMIRGIAGCERGCPADAKGLIHRGHKGFDLSYIEGGILTARAATGHGGTLCLKMFPDF